VSNVRHRLSKWVRNKIKALKSTKCSEALNRAAKERTYKEAIKSVN
jgi:hypothetical protein